MVFMGDSNKVEMLQGMQADLHKLKQKHEALISRRDTIQEMNEDFEGFLPGVRHILLASRRKELNGICGSISELIDVPEQLENAIETALGDRLQYVVVETEEHGIKAVQYLKTRQLGRAALVPLATLNGETPKIHEADPVGEMPGVIGRGIDLINFDPKYRNVISSLMGDIIIVRTLEDATHIAAKSQYRFGVFSLDGESVLANGVIIGGSAHKKSTTSLLGKKRQHIEITLQIIEIEDQIREMTENINRLKKMN
ncbi:hypothetical protein [Paenibacillus sp. GYB003]|uniref:hypothetical protein n=1 Tax=Paenibacillus sp. GYB003 TaxID=2994392 RepID=UPI002F961DB6